MSNADGVPQDRKKRVANAIREGVLLGVLLIKGRCI
jgi:hypothetical protein